MYRLMVIIGICGLFSLQEIKAQAPSPLSFLERLAQSSGQKQGHAYGSFADVVEKLLPTVVNISTSRNVKPGQKNEDDDEGTDDADSGDQDSPFQKFFNNHMNRKTPPDDGMDRLQALGSGFIVDSSGLIVTNYHVIKDADQILITLQNNETLKAVLKGYDERADLALLKVNAKKPLKVVHFGDSDQSRIGDWVLAIGNPYGLSGTVTFGIISSRGRDIEQGAYDDFIQTDAPINKGNSGGPLFNVKGEVVGVNTAIFSPSGGSIGIAFAIPSNEAKDIIEQLKTKGKVTRGWIGVNIQDITESIANSLNVTPFQGALIVKVEKNSPAEKAGLRAGDIIQKVNGKTVNVHAVSRLIAAVPDETEISLEILRQGKQVDLPVTVYAVDDNNRNHVKAGNDQNSKDMAASIKELDISVSMITDMLRQKYNLSETQQGLVVVEVHHKEKNLLQRLKPGDVIVGTNSQSVTDVSVLQDAIKSIELENGKKGSKKRNSILLLVQSGTVMHWVAVPFLSRQKFHVGKN